ncbi:MAG: PQQ-binding-like beta-propeller repeat protein [Verrucomicrobiaceae bacterium]
MSAFRFAYLACFSLIGSTLFSSAEGPSWTGWRGANRDAKVEGFVAPKEWPEELEKIWTSEVGDGYATPLVVGERVFQHAREGGKEVVLCLNLKNGEELWRSEVGVEFEAGRGGERHGLGPKSTPTIADGRVFTLSITGVLSAWSSEDGKLLWRRDFQERFEKAHPYWGTATSPIVDGGRIFVHTGSCEEGALFCLDVTSGKDIWVNEEHAHCYSSPLIETIDGVRQLVEFNHAGLCGIDLADGRVLWNHSFPHHGNNQNTPTPVRHEDLFIVGGENRGMFAVRPKKEGGEWSVERVWRHRDVSFDMSSPVMNGGLIYGFSEFKMGRICCLDPKTGKVLWEGDPRMGKNGQFLSLPGYVLALTDQGLLRVLRGNDEKYEVVRTYRLAEDDTWTAPALVGDVLLSKAGDHLTAWRFPQGEGR